MRIGLFTNTYRPDINGVVRSITTFKDELVRQGHSVYVFAPEKPHYQDEEYGIFRYPAVPLPIPVKFPMTLPVSSRIEEIVPRLKLDILHSQHPAMLGEEAVNYARKLNLPHIFTHHTQYEDYSHYFPFPQGIVKLVTRQIIHAFLSRCVKIIAPSESLYLQLKHRYPHFAEKINVLPSPVDLARFTPSATDADLVRRRYGLHDAFTFVSVGRLTAEKNVDMLLQAFARIAAKYRPARLLIVGDGPDRKRLKQQADALGIAAQTIFAGAVDYDEVPAYLAAGDAFAFASVTETQGLVVLEGMAAGLPVAAVDGPGSRDVVNDGANGLLVENNPESLAAGMQQLLFNASLRKTLAQGATVTAQSYSPERLTNRLVDFYAETIDLYQRNPLEYDRLSANAESLRVSSAQRLSGVASGADWWESLAAFWQKLDN